MKPAAAPAPAPSACAGTPAGVKHIYVSIGQQHLWACTGTVLLTDTSITTGASAITNVHYATPIGTSHITGKSRNTVLAGRDVNGPWNDPVKFWMPFDGGVGFHDASWQTFPYGSDLYKTQGSHGCVHVPAAVIATLFDWAPVGTLVTVKN
jgi:lipoprotein-anchoring transpeptidase ErfK/SrfK